MLRNSLLADAAASGAMAVLLMAGAGPLASWLGLPAALLFWAGLGLAPWTVLLLAASRRPAIARWLLLDIVLVNALWAAASFAIMAFGWVQPSALGIAFVSAQAVAVATFAAVQAFAGLRGPRLAGSSTPAG